MCQTVRELASPAEPYNHQLELAIPQVRVLFCPHPNAIIVKTASLQGVLQIAVTVPASRSSPLTYSDVLVSADCDHPLSTPPPDCTASAMSTHLFSRNLASSGGIGRRMTSMSQIVVFAAEMEGNRSDAGSVPMTCRTTVVLPAPVVPMN